VVLHVDAHEGAQLGSPGHDFGDAGAAGVGIDAEAHLAELEAHVSVKSPFRERGEGLEVGVNGDAGLADRSHRFAQDVDRGVEPCVPDPFQRRDGVAERLAGDEPVNEASRHWQAASQAPDRASSGQRKERRAHRPFGQRPERRRQAHRPITPDRRSSHT